MVSIDLESKGIYGKPVDECARGFRDRIGCVDQIFALKAVLFRN